MEKEAATRTVIPQKSMFEASREKKRARRYHSRNFTMGYVKPDKRYLSRAGLRGRKRWLLVALIVSVYCVTVGQLLVTSTIFGILHFKASGSEYLRFASDGGTILPKGADIAYAQLLASVLGYFNESITVTTHNYPIVLEAGNQRNVPAGDRVLNSSQAYFEPGVVRLLPFSNFSISSADEKNMLSVNSSFMVLQSAAARFNDLTASNVVTKQVVAQKDLSVSSPLISVSSVVGVSMQGQQVTANSDKITLLSQAAINLDGRRGVSMRRLPMSASGSASASGSGYRLCACSSGMLFLVPTTSVGCRANEAINPCTKV